MTENKPEHKLEKLIGAKRSPRQRLTLYIPDKDKNGQPIKNHEKWVAEAKTILAKHGGGATTFQPANGQWNTQGGREPVREKTVIIFTYIEREKVAGIAGELREFLHRFGRESNQDAVMYEFGNGIFFIRRFDSK